MASGDFGCLEASKSFIPVSAVRRFELADGLDKMQCASPVLAKRCWLRL